MVVNMIDKTTILQFMQTLTSQPISEKELLRSLHVNPDDRPRLKKFLRELIASGDLQENGPLVLCSGHTIRFNPDQQRQLGQLMRRFAASPLSPPTIKECQAEIGDDLVNALIETGELVAVSSEVVFDWQTYQRMLADVRRLIENKGTLSVAEARDYFNTSRRYVLAFLEHLDAIGVTVRDGDVRKLKQAGNQGNGNQVVRN